MKMVVGKSLQEAQQEFETIIINSIRFRKLKNSRKVIISTDLIFPNQTENDLSATDWNTEIYL